MTLYLCCVCGPSQRERYPVECEPPMGSVVVHIFFSRAIGYLIPPFIQRRTLTEHPGAEWRPGGASGWAPPVVAAKVR